MIKKVTKNTRLLPALTKAGGEEVYLQAKDVEPAREYIAKYWPNLIKTTPKDRGTLIGLPNPYIVPAADPNASFSFEEQYYWDSYFTIIGLNKDYDDLAEGMLDNLLHLRKRFGLIPNASRMYFTSRSQPPILTSYIWHIYKNNNKSAIWLKSKMAEAEQEYHDVWMSNKHPNWHKNGDLNRYYDINALHDLAEAESGWDMTTRFDRKCLDFWPIDLNCLLYKYETDFAAAAKINNDEQAANKWLKAAKNRKDLVNKYLWSESKGFYFDYNFDKSDRGKVWSLASYYSMWAKLATPEQAQKLVKNLSKFEYASGLSTTSKPIIDLNIFGSVETQWVYPNGWAPLQYIVIKGLQNYNYYDEAKRLAHKWLKTNLGWFNQNNEFLEKYNVVKPAMHPKEGVYPSQTGFGWTNAIFEALCRDFIDG